MKRNILIWRESVYKNGFKCSCGTLMFDVAKGEITDNVLSDDSHILYCAKCGRANGRIHDRQMEVEEGEPILRGLWKGDMS